MEEIRTLIRQRSTLKASLTRIQNFLAEPNVTNKELLLEKKDRVEEIWVNFKTNYNEMLNRVEDNAMEALQEEFLDFEEKVLACKAELTAELNSDLRSASSQESLYYAAVQPPLSQFVNLGINLPKMQLPKFDGRPDNWDTFYKSFGAIIHEKTNLDDHLKFQYLVSCLEGDAAEIISNIQVCKENYKFAWESLEKRYKNSKILIERHISNLFNMTKVEIPSAAALRELHSTALKNINALERLEVKVKEADPFLIYLISSKFDRGTLRAWEEFSTKNERPRYSDLDAFLLHRCDWLEAYENRDTSTAKRLQSKAKPPARALLANPNACSICQRHGHGSLTCGNLLSQSIEKRRAMVKDARVCWVCLKPGHRAADCDGEGCENCNGRHSRVLCLKRLVTDEAGGAAVAMHAKATGSRPWSGLAPLPTAVVGLHGSSGSKKGRFILDTGSQLNFITTEAAEGLGLRWMKDPTEIRGIGHSVSRAKHYSFVEITSLWGSYRRKLKVFILDDLTGPTDSIDFSDWKLPVWVKNELADPEFHVKTKKIDGILNAAVFFDILSSKCFRMEVAGSPHYFQKTALGWIFSANSNPSYRCATVQNFLIRATVPGLDDSDTEIDEPCPSTKKTAISVENEECKQFFLKTVNLKEDGKFEVRLPFREDPAELGESLSGVKQRFFSLERKLNANVDLKSEYTRFMKEYLELGHMEEIPKEDIPKVPHYYFPHHAIAKRDNPSKFRVVFDASFKSNNGKSLNQILMTGPPLHNDLLDILLAFRFPKYALSADVSKMYRQIWVSTEDREYQRILWRESPDQPLKHFRLKTVTYGTGSAPFAAIKCLHLIAEEYATDSPWLEDVIRKDFFMDDLLSGGESLEELRRLYEGLNTAFSRRGLPLRKWCTNAQELLTEISDTEDWLDISDGEGVRALGIGWRPRTDTFVHCTQPFNESAHDQLTKRKIHSELQSFWDPLGMLVPVVIRGKMFLQELWLESFQWDDQLPNSLQRKWNKFRKDLSLVNGMEIPRRVVSDEEFSLHGFSDASEKAYGCAIFAVSYSRHHPSSHLICAKSRVTPLKVENIPRLELMAAILLTDMMERLLTCIKGKAHTVHYWSDSRITLHWIRGCPKEWKTFVANRVSHIQKFSAPEQLGYVSSMENPADLASRGILPALLKDNTLWWHGPEWLRGLSALNFSMEEKIDPNSVPERRKVVFSLLIASQGWDLLTRYSSWRRLVSITAYILRFLNNGRIKEVQQRSGGLLSVGELAQAEAFIIRLVQEDHFRKELDLLKRGNPLHSRSSLVPLSVFLDDGIIRVGGRLKNSTLSREEKHPIVLPFNHHVTKLLIEHFHRENVHCGPQTTLPILRCKYWPLKGKSAVKAVIHQCVVCRRADPHPLKQIMADLPASRVNPGRPFETCGVDFAGPLDIMYGLRKTQKAYVAVFICFAVKAIHLELVTSLSSAAFMAALRRFFSRRGTSRRIFSDNGTNFVGALKELKKLITPNEVQEECSQRGVEWHFIPPSAPHFGGLWEAGVKLMKNQMKKTLSTALLTFEEVYTLLTQIEACLNSRPLTPLSDDPNDVSPLTPAHFLLGQPLSLPYHPVEPPRPPVGKRWELVQHLQLEFWRRWQRDYLTSLQQRTSWKIARDNLKVGALVIVKEDNLPPMQWRTARVKETYPGADGLVRVALVKFANGSEVKRPIVKLCLLLDE